MKSSPLLALMPILLASCASVPTTDLNADRPEMRAQVERRMGEILDAVERKDFPRLDSYHSYGPKFTKFAEQSGRLDADAARQGEHVGLASLNSLVLRTDDLKIDVLGDVAIATFIADATFKAGGDTVDKRSRGTLVFVKDRGDWKITHEHFSPLITGP